MESTKDRAEVHVCVGVLVKSTVANIKMEIFTHSKSRLHLFIYFSECQISLL